MKRIFSRSLTAAVALLALSLALPAGALAGGYDDDDDDRRSRLFGDRDTRQQATVYGQSYGDWQAEWWQWLYSFDRDNPLFEEGDIDCTRGQDEHTLSRRVVFLAGVGSPLGAPGDPPVTRACTIRRNQALFFPLVNAIFVNEPGDCGRDDGCSVEEKQAALNETFTEGEGVVDTRFLHATLDGEPIALSAALVRTASDPFAIDVGEGDPFFPPGTMDDEAVSDGYWVMLPPLDRGHHELRYGGNIVEGGLDLNGNGTVDDDLFVVDVIYDLRVR